MDPRAADIELLVVGAGPAGVAAAITATREGLRPVVVDRARFPRDKTCGDGLTAGALHRLEDLGLDVRRLSSYEGIREAVIVSPSGRRVELPLGADGEHAGVVTRVELDAALVALAREAGVDVREETAVTDLRVDAHGVDVVLGDGGSCRARWVVAADGHYSPIRRRLAPAPTRDLGTWHAFRQYWSGVDERRLWAIFEEDLLPGYAWVFPLAGGRANVGFGVLRGHARGGKALASLWHSVLERASVRAALGPRAEPEGTHRAWPIPAAYDDASLAHGRVLFVGDAAAVVDPMTGEGIAQAIETGMLAARAVAGGPGPAIVAARYRRDVRAALGADLRIAGALQQVLRSPLGARAAVRAAGLTPWTRRNFARWMFEDYPRALAFTPRRWRPGAFGAPGAYVASA